MKNNTNQTSRRDFLKKLATAGGLLVVPCNAMMAALEGVEDYDPEAHEWAYAIDISRCIGCCACMRACRAENNVPDGYYRTWIERYRIREDGEVDVDAPISEDRGFQPAEGQVAKAFFVPKMCNHCDNSVCTQVCPVGAAYHAKDGTVLVDSEHCIGCGYCVQACPYGCRFINPQTHVADKCTWCYHRTTKGELPACVQACPRGVRIFGDLKDPNSRISILLKQRSYSVLKPGMGTEPRCFYNNMDKEVI